MSDPTYERRTDQEYTVGVWDMTFYKIDPETNEPLQNKDGTTKVFYSNNIDAGYWASGIDPDDLIEMEELEYSSNTHHSENPVQTKLQEVLFDLYDNKQTDLAEKLEEIEVELFIAERWRNVKSGNTLK